MYEIIIVGGGPAGASAAVFAARAGLSTLVIDADKGMTRRAMLNNHLGFPNGITGPELVDLGREHAVKSGAEWIDGQVTTIKSSDTVMVTTDHETYEGRTLVLCVGINASLAADAGLETLPGTEPRIATIIATDVDGRTNVPGIWAAGTAGGVSVHTIITAGDGARVAINVISEQKGERWVDHDIMPS